MYMLDINRHANWVNQTDFERRNDKTQIKLE